LLKTTISFIHYLRLAHKQGQAEAGTGLDQDYRIIRQPPKLGIALKRCRNTCHSAGQIGEKKKKERKASVTVQGLSWYWCVPKGRAAPLVSKIAKFLTMQEEPWPKSVQMKLLASDRQGQQNAARIIESGPSSRGSLFPLFRQERSNESTLAPVVSCDQASWFRLHQPLLGRDVCACTSVAYTSNFSHPMIQY
jgi:hypothetical protein